MERRIAITYFLYISLISSLGWELSSPRIPFKIFTWVERLLDVSSAIVEWYFDNPQPLVLITLAGASLGAGKHMIKPTFRGPTFGGATRRNFPSSDRSPMAFGRWKHARIKATNRGCSTKCSRGTSRLAWVNRLIFPSLRHFRFVTSCSETSGHAQCAMELADVECSQSLITWVSGTVSEFLVQLSCQQLIPVAIGLFQSVWLLAQTHEHGYIHWLLESAESPGSKQLVPLGMARNTCIRKPGSLTENIWKQLFSRPATKLCVCTDLPTGSCVLTPTQII